MTKKLEFNFELGFSRAYKDNDGNMHIVGVASDTAPDLQGDRMSKKALDDMASQLEDGIDLLDSHRSTFGFGKTTGGVVTKNGNEYELVIDAKLDNRYPQSKELFRCVEDGTCDKQMSIGGEINMDARDAITFEERNDGSFVRVINSIQLDHIATTRKDRAANPRTKFMQAIIKDIVGEGENEITPEKYKNFSKEISKDSPTNVSKETTEPQTSETETPVENPIEKGQCPHCGTKCSTALMKKDDWSCQNCFGTIEEWELHKDSAMENIIPFKSFPLIERDSQDDTIITKEDLQTLEKNEESYELAHVFYVVGKDNAKDSSSFQLAHHKLHKDKVQTTFKGVVSSIASIITSSFKSVEIDEDTRSHGFAHLSRHLREFGFTSPTIKEFLTFKEVDEFIIWMARVNNIDISFAKNINEQEDLSCFGKKAEKSVEQTKQDDINTALSFFGQVGRDLRTEKEDHIDPVLNAFSKNQKPSETTKTEKDNPEMDKKKETTTDEPLVLGKEATAETIFKGMDWIMGNIRNTNLAQQPDLAEKMRKYFSSFQQLLAQDGILKKDNVDDVPSTETTNDETTGSETETTTPQETTDPVTEKSVQEIVELASPLIAAQLATLMKEGFSPEAVMKAYNTTFQDSLDKSLEKSVNTIQEKIEHITKDIAKTNDRLGKVEQVSGTKQSAPTNGDQDPSDPNVTKERKPNSKNPFEGFWDAPVKKALSTMGTPSA